MGGGKGLSDERRKGEKEDERRISEPSYPVQGNASALLPPPPG